jgi:hypothetical protein
LKPHGVRSSETHGDGSFMVLASITTRVAVARREPRCRFPVWEPAGVPCKENRQYPISTTPEIG